MKNSKPKSAGWLKNMRNWRNRPSYWRSSSETKVRLLEDRINNKFKLARFKLFEVQVNGAVVERCDTTFSGVPYSNLNNGARINIGLDIINTLAEHFGFSPVVFIDNAESVTDILPTNGQQIRLIVSEKDKKLRVEVL